MNEPLQRALGARLRALRGQAGRTLRSVADEAGVTATHLSYVERGERLPSLEVLAELARALSLPLSALLPSSDAPDAGAEALAALTRLVAEQRAGPRELERLERVLVALLDEVP